MDFCIICLMDFCNGLLSMSLDCLYVRIMYKTHQNRIHFLNSYTLCILSLDSMFHFVLKEYWIDVVIQCLYQEKKENNYSSISLISQLSVQIWKLFPHDCLILRISLLSGCGVLNSWYVLSPDWSFPWISILVIVNWRLCKYLNNCSKSWIVRPNLTWTRSLKVQSVCRFYWLVFFTSQLCWVDLKN